MKRHEYIFIAVAGMLSVLSCTIEHLPADYSSDSDALRVTASIKGIYTKTSPSGTDAEQAVFSKGDVIYVRNEYAGMYFEYSGSAWNPTDNYYVRWNGEPMSVEAVYPATDGATVSDFTVPSSQQKLQYLASADYMTCAVDAAVKPADGILRLEMVRKMAKVVVNLKDVEDGTKIQALKIMSYKGYAGGETVDDFTSITPYAYVADGGYAGQSGTVYTAIVVPGEASPSMSFLSFYYNGVSYEMKGLPEAEAGKCYEYDLSIEGSEVSLELVSSGDWTSGTINGGDAQWVRQDFFIRPEATGDGSGRDWDNAMGPDELRTLIATVQDADQTSANARKVDGKYFYFAEGRYLIADDVQKYVKIEYSGYKKQVKMFFQGGYDPQSTAFDISRRNTETFRTILTGDANGDNAVDQLDRALFVIGNQVNISFDGITFSEIVSDFSGTTGALYVASGASGDATLTVKDCVFENCLNYSSQNGSKKAVAGGSAISVVGSGDRLDVSNTVFRNCNSYYHGGAVKTTGAAHASFYNCEFTECTAYGNASWGGGAGIFAGESGVTVDNCLFTRCSSPLNGGAIRLDDADAKVYVSNSVFEDCSQTTSNSSKDGGAAIWFSKGSVWCNKVKFLNNTSVSRGGAIRASGENSSVIANLFLNACTFYGNSSGMWGHSIQATNANLCIYNSTFEKSLTGETEECSSAVINGTAAALIVSSTIIDTEDESMNNGLIRLEGSNTSVLMNNIIINRTPGKAIVNPLGADTEVRSAGYNLLGGEILTPENYISSVDDSMDCTVEGLGLTYDNTDYVYTWKGMVSGHTKAGSGQIREEMMAFSSPSYVNIGSDFVEWIESLGAFDSDQLGSPRDPEAVWPGAYQR